VEAAAIVEGFDVAEERGAEESTGRRLREPTLTLEPSTAVAKDLVPEDAPVVYLQSASLSALRAAVAQLPYS
jgi:hypothetical protein